MIILGISGALGYDGNNQNSWVHGSGVSLIKNGVLLNAVSEERFTRNKYEGNFPNLSLESILKKNNLTTLDVDVVCYASNHTTTTFRLINNDLNSFLRQIFTNAKIIEYDHHSCHAALSFGTSPFEESTVFTLDSAGDWFPNDDDSDEDLFFNYGLIGKFTKHPFSFVRYQSFTSVGFTRNPNKKITNMSVGAFYNNLSMFIMQKLVMTKKLINSENKYIFDNSILREAASGKVMGLSAFGKNIDLPSPFKILKYTAHDIPKLVTQMKFWNIDVPSCFSKHSPEDLAFWMQKEFEDCVVNYFKSFPKGVLSKNLTYSGGCALNINLNSRLLKEEIFENVHVPTAPNDDGLCLGASLLYCLENNIKVQLPNNLATLGLSYDIDKNNIIKLLGKHSSQFKVSYLSDENLFDVVASNLQQNKVVAWFQGNSEFGPRALMNRSILANPCFDNRQKLNTVIKKREYWRPYAACVLEGHANEWFDMVKTDHNYMLFASLVRESKITKIPSVVHVDKTCRVQIVNKNINLKAYNLIKAFYELTSIPLLLNTSFNTIKQEPIVETPADAVKSFLLSKIDILVLNNYFVERIQNHYETHNGEAVKVEPNEC